MIRVTTHREQEYDKDDNLINEKYTVIIKCFGRTIKKDVRTYVGRHIKNGRQDVGYKPKT